MNLNQTPTIHAVICIVINDKKELLLLKRASGKKYFPGKWAPVGAAPLAGKENMMEIAKKEIVDELGVSGKILKREAQRALIIDDQNWIIHPFLVEIRNSQIALNEEHTEAKWINLQEITNYDTISGFSDEIIKFLSNRF